MFRSAAPDAPQYQCCYCLQPLTDLDPDIDPTGATIVGYCQPCDQWTGHDRHQPQASKRSSGLVWWFLAGCLLALFRRPRRTDGPTLVGPVTSGSPDGVPWQPPQD